MNEEIVREITVLNEALENAEDEIKRLRVENEKLGEALAAVVRMYRRVW